MSDVMVKIEGVSKKYCKSLKESMYYGLTDIGRNLVGLSSHSDRLRNNEFWSVDDVSFEVKRGETLGLVGPNGSGKTTMLKMINGIFGPDKGKITVRGKIGALIAVGAGFHPLLTGRENIYINGVILGMSKSEIERKFNSIVEFSGIGDFLDSPVKHYSSGMYVRLGFAIAVHSHCDILLIDEVLAVGDVNFQAKCIEKIKSLDREGITKIFVSHSFDAVQQLCPNAIYLSQGKIHRQGETSQVLEEFRKDVIAGRVDDAKALRRGSREIEITKIEFLDAAGLAKQSFQRGERLRIKISFWAKKAIQEPSFLITIFQEDGQPIYNTKTHSYSFKMGWVHGHAGIVYTIESVPLHTGKYWFSIGCFDSSGYIPYDYHEKMYFLLIEKGSDIPDEWEMVQ